jgi:putative hemin transport protein
MMEKAIEQQVDLKERWALFQAANPKVRIRDAAAQLGVSEAELLATEIGENVVRLTDNFDELLQEFHTLGLIMALTRNDEIVHERKGEYGNVEVMNGHNKMGLVLGEDIDLRIFFGIWRFGFAVTGENSLGTHRSFQFFDLAGTAIHKVFLTEKSDLKAYEKLVEKYRSDDQSPTINVSPIAAKPADKPDAEIDVKNFRNAWANLKDTHDFFPLLKKFGVGREQALRLASREMAFQVPIDSYQYILQKAGDTKLPIMIFVGNDGIIQIHTGEVENVLVARGWFNVMDEKFNLHINQREIGSTWIVKKPTTEGVVSSLEIFNRHGKNVALFFGKRKPGIPEKEEWRELLSTVKPQKNKKLRP